MIRLTSTITAAMITCVRLYQVTLGPVLGGHCRFHPTCSNYAVEALRRHGPLRGARLAIGRVLRCHPWGGNGFDPVPGTNADHDGPRGERPPATRAVALEPPSALR